jgi:hypothetical protein
MDRAGQVPRSRRTARWPINNTKTSTAQTDVKPEDGSLSLCRPLSAPVNHSSAILHAVKERQTLGSRIMQTDAKIALVRRTTTHSRGKQATRRELSRRVIELGIHTHTHTHTKRRGLMTKTSDTPIKTKTTESKSSLIIEHVASVMTY